MTYETLNEACPALYKSHLKGGTTNLATVAEAIRNLRVDDTLLPKQALAYQAANKVISMSYRLSDDTTVPSWSKNYSLALLDHSGHLIAAIASHEELVPETYSNLIAVAAFKALVHLQYLGKAVDQIGLGLNDIDNFVSAQARGYSKHQGSGHDNAYVIGTSGCLPSNHYLKLTPHNKDLDLLVAENINHQGAFDVAWARYFLLTTSHESLGLQKEPEEITQIRAWQ